MKFRINKKRDKRTIEYKWKEILAKLILDFPQTIFEINSTKLTKNKENFNSLITELRKELHNHTENLKAE